jgi:hypothetical protein
MGLGRVQEISEIENGRPSGVQARAAEVNDVKAEPLKFLIPFLPCPQQI